MANLEELKKLAEEKGIELTDDILADVAGGAYSEEEWRNMTKEEREAAQMRSIMAKLKGEACELD